MVQVVNCPHFLKIAAKLHKNCETCKFFVYLLFLFYKKTRFKVIFDQNRQEFHPNIRYPICRLEWSKCVRAATSLQHEPL